MKKAKIFIIVLCVTATLTCFGCGAKKLDSAKIVRDEARTGGSLSFVYDKNQRKVYVGGEDEVFQYSFEDLSRGLSEGCRFGIKVTAPDEMLDLEKATLEINGVNYSSGDFLEKINGEKQRFFNFYPLFSKDNMKLKFAVIWQDGTKKQEYKIIVVDGTRFMNKNGEIEL